MRYVPRLLLLVALGLSAFWFLGRERPIKVVRAAELAGAPCEICGGSGAVPCAACDGHGSDYAARDCPDCGGTGRGEWRLKRPEGSMTGSGPNCMRCKGKGRLTTTTRCAVCEGHAKTPCEACGGVPQPRASDPEKICVEGYSPWEQALQSVRWPVDPNPAPWRNRAGEYPLVIRYLELGAKSRGVRLVEWGEFRPAGSVWTLSARAEWAEAAGAVTARSVEFTVRDRALVRVRTLP